MSLYLGTTKIPDVRLSLESPTGLVDTSDATLYRSDHLAAGYTAYARRKKYTGTAALNPTVTFENDTVAIPAGVYTSAQDVALDVSTLTATQNGTYTPEGDYYSSVVVNVTSEGYDTQTKTVTPTKNTQTVTPDAGYDGLSSVTVNPIPASYIIPTGIVSITSNGTVDVSSYASASVNVSGGSPALQSKSVTPTETAQTVEPDSGYDGLSDVTVGAISSSYVGSSITQRSSTDLTTSGLTVNVPAGYYGTSASKSVTPTLQAKTVSPTESQQVAEPDAGNDGLSSVTVNAISSTYVGSGITARSSSDLTASGATVTAPAGYYATAASKSIASGSAATPATTVTANPSISISSTGLITATASATKSVTPTVSAGYVSSGTAGTITVSGSNTEQLTTQAATTITPAESEQTAVASGVYTTGIVKVGAISSSYIGSAITQRSSSDLTASGATVTVPAGYYSAQATKSVSSGTAGTPTATKGTVSNHAVTVTPSVTNTAGYISGGTVSGTGVSVSASELVSGSETKTSNGTYDVTNLASLVVTVPIVTYYTGSSAPSSSTGSDGDIYLQTS